MSYDVIESGRTCSKCSMMLGKGPDWCDNCNMARVRRVVYDRFSSEPEMKRDGKNIVYTAHDERSNPVIQAIVAQEGVVDAQGNMFAPGSIKLDPSDNYFTSEIRHERD